MNEMAWHSDSSFPALVSFCDLYLYAVKYIEEESRL